MEEGGNRSFLKALSAAQGRTSAVEAYRPLSHLEIQALERSGCTAEDWSLVLLKDDAYLREDRVSRCHFIGKNLLDGDLDGLSEIEPGVPHAHGLYESTLSNCVIGRRVLVKGNQILRNVVVGDGAVLVGNGIVACRSRTMFSAGMEVRVGSEVEGRPVVIDPEMSMDEVLAQALPTDASASVVETSEYVERTRWLFGRVSSTVTIIEPQAVVMGCSRLVDCYVGSGALLRDSEVEEVTILSSPSERSSITSGCIVRSSVLQHGVEVSDRATVCNSFLMEHVNIEHNGQVHHTIAFPDSSIARGESHHSLVGPFTGFHHQSLLIAALWPGGRGNVAYGAKIGSNHTGRVADQEALLGEGVFFGLGCIVKYPVNTMESPYTLFAADTTVDRQRLHFPFSLVAQCLDPALKSQAQNQIRPGWMLYANAFSIMRNETKFMKRSKAKRHKTTWPIFRPELVKLMLEARQRLRVALSSGEASSFANARVEGLGANVMTRKSAEEGVQAYTMWVRRYVLQGLLTFVADEPTESETWQHQQTVLRAEVGDDVRVSVLLDEALSIEETVVASVEKSKAGDDMRGAATIDDYARTHTQAASDAVVVAAKHRLEQLKGRVERLKGLAKAQQTWSQCL